MDTMECLICHASIGAKVRRFGYRDCYDTHTFCKECFLRLLRRNQKCPIDQRPNSTFVFKEDDVRHELFRDYEGTAADELGEEEIGSGMEGVVTYDFCLKCLDEVSGDTVMFSLAECPRSHRVCFDCAVRNRLCPCRRGCIGFRDRSAGGLCKDDKVLYYSSRATGVGPTVAVSRMIIHGVRHLQNSSAEGAKEVLAIARSTLRFPRDICITCLREIDGRTCGLSNCYQEHGFCEGCVGEAINTALMCPIDREPFGTVYIMDGERIRHGIQVHNWRIKEYLGTLGVRNERAQAMLETIEWWDEFYEGFPATLCLDCFTDTAGVVYGFKTARGDRHNYCEECARGITTRGNQGPIEGAPYREMGVVEAGAYERTLAHHMQILEYARLHGLALEEAWWRYNNQFLCKCVKCGQPGQMIRWRLNTNLYKTECECHALCCDTCITITDYKIDCPFELAV